MEEAPYIATTRRINLSVSNKQADIEKIAIRTLFTQIAQVRTTTSCPSLTNSTSMTGFFFKRTSTVYGKFAMELSRQRYMQNA